MPDRQFYCWKVSVTYRCGCVVLSDTHHSCAANREKCSSWTTYRETAKDCDTHRIGGLDSSSDSNESSQDSSSVASS